MKKRKIAVDLTWVRHNKVGGTESCVRNLLDGFTQINTKGMTFVLLLAEDNAESFSRYRISGNFELRICDVKSENPKERLLWQNLKMGKMLRSLDIGLCLEPVYGKPFWGTRGIKFITVIHDLQAIHYPQYFSRGRTAWMKASWKNAVNTSEMIIAISEYVKQDIREVYGVREDKIQVIYDAVVLDRDNCSADSGLEKYGVEKGRYYYTVSSLLPHKNLKTVILALGELKRRKSPAFYPLLVSGVGGKNRDQLELLIREKGLQGDIIFTPFVEDAERNMLYKNCKVFLFSSIFEGFGMPPIEAMAMGVPVLTTKCTSLGEVTGELLNYVRKPQDEKEWADRLEKELRLPEEHLVKQLLGRYACAAVAKQYIDLLETLE
jgi:glycosyltransferase involved in cell wall biosynthesis